MVTPPPKAQSGPSTKTYTIEEKQQLLDNFDLEGESLIPNLAIRHLDQVSGRVGDLL